jgi:hypothetical protein
MQFETINLSFKGGRLAIPAVLKRLMRTVIRKPYLNDMKQPPLINSVKVE